MFLTMLIVWPIMSVTRNQISRIDNVFLIPVAPVNITTIFDSTRDQCICLALDSHSAAVNYFLDKNACQLFDRVPITYQLQPNAQATVYLSSGSSTNASQCCMPDLNILIEKLENAMITSANQPNPRCLALDNHGYLVTVQYGENVIMRYSSPDLIVIDRIPLSENDAKSITFHDNAYYVGTDSKSIEVVDSNSLLTVNVITDPTMSGVRDIVFLHDGDTMVVSSINNQKILFFKRAERFIGRLHLVLRDINLLPSSAWTLVCQWFLLLRNIMGREQCLFLHDGGWCRMDRKAIQWCEPRGRRWWSFTCDGRYVWSEMGFTSGQHPVHIR